MGVAAAIAGAAVIGGVSQVVSGNKQAGAIKDSAAASDATNRYIYDTTRKDNAYAKGIGESALGKLAKMYGVSSGGDDTDWEGFVKSDPAAMRDWRANHSDKTLSEYGKYYYQNDVGFRSGAIADASGNKYAGADPNYQGRDLAPFQTAAGGAGDYGGFETSPGYQFRVDEAMKAIERSAAARGSLRSGATMDALQRRVQGVASSEYENYANRLAALAGIGQNANAADAQAGQAYAGQQTQTNMAAGQARASAYANTGSAINQGVQNLTSAFLYNKGYGGAGGSGAPPPGYGGSWV